MTLTKELIRVIQESAHMDICVLCAREIDLRFNRHIDMGNGFNRHEECPPRLIFYT